MFELLTQFPDGPVDSVQRACDASAHADQCE